MVGQPVDLLDQPVGVELFDGLDDPRMENAPPLLQEAPIGNLVGEGVLEGVFEIREQAYLVEKLGGLKVGEAVAERILG